MALIIQKYGGTSVGSIELIQAVADKVIATHGQGHQVVVVVSAMGGETDRLIGLSQEICSRPSERELDVLLSTGEQVTIALLSMALQAKGFAAESFTGAQVCILTDSVHNKARIMDIDAMRVSKALDAHKVVVVAAHGNSLRALVKHLDGISDEEISSLNIPTGIPLVYQLDGDLRKVSGSYLGDPEAAAAAAAAVAAQASGG